MTRRKVRRLDFKLMFDQLYFLFFKKPQINIYIFIFIIILF